MGKTFLSFYRLDDTDKKNLTEKYSENTSSDILNEVCFSKALQGRPELKKSLKNLIVKMCDDIWNNHGEIDLSFESLKEISAMISELNASPKPKAKSAAKPKTTSASKSKDTSVSKPKTAPATEPKAASATKPNNITVIRPSTVKEKSNSIPRSKISDGKSYKYAPHNGSEQKYNASDSSVHNHTVRLMPDGTVIASGNNEYGQCDVKNWKNIEAVSAGAMHTVGLKSDGTVIASGNNKYGQCDVKDWKNIVAIFAGSTYTVGLKEDGKIVVAGTNYKGIRLEIMCFGKTGKQKLKLFP